MTGSNLYRTRPEPGGEMDQAQARALLAGEAARLLRLLQLRPATGPWHRCSE